MKNLVIILSVLTFGCASVEVKTTDAPETDLGAYKTYNYNDMNFVRQDSIPYSKNTYNYFIQQMNEHMQAKGFELSDDPQLVLNVFAVVKQEQELEEPDDRRYMGQRLNNREEPKVVSYDVGDLVVSFIDKQKNILLWQASSEMVLSKNDNKMKKKIENSTEQIFEKFPFQ
jgi:hypothetical protein